MREIDDLLNFEYRLNEVCVLPHLIILLKLRTKVELNESSH